MRGRVWIAAVVFLAAGCGGESSPGTSTGARAGKLRISTIPDSDATALEARFGAVAARLEAALGRRVEYTPVKDYAASVTGIATGRLDLVWFGGVTAVQADMQAPGALEFVACRDIDTRFKTYFIAGRESGIGTVADLGALARRAAGKKFSFGSKSSTSGHVMPRHFFIAQSGKRPEEAFAMVAYSGSHDVTLRQVANGDVDVGALNYTNYEKADPALREKAPVIYTTPEYVDYVWVARRDLGADVIARVREAFVSLDPAGADDRRILDAFKAGRFVPAEREWWGGIRRVLEAGVDVGS